VAAFAVGRATPAALAVLFVVVRVFPLRRGRASHFVEGLEEDKRRFKLPPATSLLTSACSGLLVACRTFSFFPFLVSSRLNEQSTSELISPNSAGALFLYQARAASLGAHFVMVRGAWLPVVHS
jgi:hypothetical protein